MKNPEDEWIKDNLLRLATHHKVNCKGKNCGICLLAVMVALKRLNIRLTEEEARGLV